MGCPKKGEEPGAISDTSASSFLGPTHRLSDSLASTHPNDTMVAEGVEFWDSERAVQSHPRSCCTGPFAVGFPRSLFGSDRIAALDGDGNSREAIGNELIERFWVGGGCARGRGGRREEGEKDVAAGKKHLFGREHAAVFWSSAS